jgi:streptogramin lyase/plastocyanin
MSEGRLRAALMLVATCAWITSGAWMSAIAWATALDPRTIQYNQVTQQPEAKYTPGNGFIVETALGNPASGPAMVAVDDEDRIWIALARSGELAVISNGHVTTHPLGPDSRPVGIIAGTRANGYPGSLWIAASYDNKIIRFDWRNGVQRSYPLAGQSWPFNIALDSHGKIWFTQRAGGRLGRLDPVTGKIANFPLGASGNPGPAGLGIDLRNDRVWFTESFADTIGSLSADGHLTLYRMGTSSTGMISGPAGLAVDSHGGVWFAKLEGQLGHIAPGSTHIDLIPTPKMFPRPAGVTVDSRGHVWLAALDGNALLEFRPDEGDFRTFALPIGAADTHPGAPPQARTSRPFGLAFDHDGDLWFSQQYTGQIGVLDVGAPHAAIVSPGPLVNSADPYVTVQTEDRVSGIAEQGFSLDNHPIQLPSGRLDLSHVLPGQHSLKLVVSDHAHNSTEATASFNYAPTEAAVPAIISQMRFVPGSAAAFRDSVSMAAGDANDQDRATTLLQLLQAHPEQLAPAERDIVIAQLNWIQAHATQEQTVAIIDQPPYFHPAQVRLRAGGTVTWLYSGDRPGHEISHDLHQLQEAKAGFKSPLLRAGDRYSQRFEQPGTYTVVDDKRPGAQLSVVVTE